jgi:hypothetical protein
MRGKTSDFMSRTSVRFAYIPERNIQTIPKMSEITKSRARVLDDGRRVRVVTGWNYTHYHFWFVVYVQRPGGREVHIPAADSTDDDEQSAFERGFLVGIQARAE